MQSVLGNDTIWRLKWAVEAIATPQGHLEPVEKSCCEKANAIHQGVLGEGNFAPSSLDGRWTPEASKGYRHETTIAHSNSCSCVCLHVCLRAWGGDRCRDC